MLQSINEYVNTCDKIKCEEHIDEMTFNKNEMIEDGCRKCIIEIMNCLDINEQLYYACKYGHTEIVEKMVTRVVKEIGRDNTRRLFYMEGIVGVCIGTLYEDVVQREYKNILEVLVSKDQMTWRGVLELASKIGNKAIVIFSIEKYEENDSDPASFRAVVDYGNALRNARQFCHECDASRCGHKEIEKILIEKLGKRHDYF